jgi:superoxide dismutase, Cu-Zn family
MKTIRTVSTGYLLPRAAILAVLVAIMGCEASRDIDDVAPPTQRAPTDGATENVRPDNPDRFASNEVPPSDRDLSDADRSGEASNDAQSSVGESATARITPTGQGNAEGTVTFSAAAEDGAGMLVKVDLEGLEPGRHGFHVHEVGDCSADDASSAGDHFNPSDTPHGSPDAGDHHV